MRESLVNVFETGSTPRLLGWWRGRLTTIVGAITCWMGCLTRSSCASCRARVTLLTRLTTGCGVRSSRAYLLVTNERASSQCFFETGSTSSLLVWQRGGLTTIGGAITRWMDCLTRSLCAWRGFWSAAAMLPHQPCFVPGASHAVDPADHGDAVCSSQAYLLVTSEVPLVNVF
jgi:hypothetical protein